MTSISVMCNAVEHLINMLVPVITCYNYKQLFSHMPFISLHFELKKDKDNRSCLNTKKTPQSPLS